MISSELSPHDGQRYTLDPGAIEYRTIWGEVWGPGKGARPVSTSKTNTDEMDRLTTIIR